MKIDRETEEKLLRLERSKAHEWISILRDIGEDPRTFFDNGIWINVDFSMSNMSGVAFAGAIVEGCAFEDGSIDRNSSSPLSDPEVFHMPAAAATEVPYHGGSIQDVNQRVSASGDFTEAIGIVNEELDAGGYINIDTINRLWHKLDHSIGISLVEELMARCGLDANEDTIIAVSKANKRLGGAVVDRAKVDKRKRRRAMKRIQEMMRRKR